MRTRLAGAVLGFIVCAASVSAAQSSRDRILFLNGEVLNGRLANPFLTFSTNYGEIRIAPRFIRRIQRGGDTERLETFNNEIITGHLMDDGLTFDLGGGAVMDIRKERIDKIIIGEREPAPKAYRSYFQMQNGDTIYGQVTNPSFALTTSYGAIEIPFPTIVRIEEDAGQTRVHLANGNTMQGFIATNFLYVTMNYGFDVKIPKNSIKAVIVTQ